RSGSVAIYELQRVARLAAWGEPPRGDAERAAYFEAHGAWGLARSLLSELAPKGGVRPARLARAWFLSGERGKAKEALAAEGKDELTQAWREALKR
ncbi:MAG TPA: hypothetical protein DEA08_09705, partial [Planctomycetes bacterium]|nr:hypothetical protein [Planctomycetota bacterium]